MVKDTQTVEDISLIIKSLNPKKATGPDGIPIKVLRYASNATDSHLCNIIGNDIDTNKYSEEPKTALVRPIFKKNERNKIENYRPVTILNGMSKIYERFIHNSLHNIFFCGKHTFKFHISLQESLKFKSCFTKTY